MKRVSTHVLDTARGKPAQGVPVKLERQEAPGKWLAVGSSRTDQDGRCGQLLADPANLEAGVYRLSFETAKYFAGVKVEAICITPASRSAAWRYLDTWKATLPSEPPFICGRNCRGRCRWLIFCR